MLPSELLVTRVSKGYVWPAYAKFDEANLDLAAALAKIYEKSLGRRWEEISEEVKEYEEIGFDYRFVRGLVTLLERRSLFEVKAGVDPRTVRRLAFQEANKSPVVDENARVQIMSKIAEELAIPVEEAEESLYCDLDERRILKEFRPISPKDLLREYNLSIAQTLLFKSTSLEFTAKGNWKGIFQRIKLLGLMFSAEMRADGLWVTADGPLSFFKMTERYGTSLAKLLPEVVRAETWRIRANIIREGAAGKRVLLFELNSRVEGDLLGSAQPEKELFDSFVEERFSRRFRALNIGWTLTREPEPLTVGRGVFFPDFIFRKGGAKAYLEIVGFWTPEYLDRKIKKLQQLSQVDIMIAVDENLACSKLQQLEGNVIYYKRNVPLKPIVDFLRKIEDVQLTKQTKGIKEMEIKLEGESIEIPEIANTLGVSEEAVRRALAERGTPGYRLIGNVLISEAKLSKIDSALFSLQEKTLPKAMELIEEENLKNADQIIRALGYEVHWQGMDMGKATITKARQT